MLCLVYSISEESGEEMVSPVSAFIKSICTVVCVLASEYMVHPTEHIKGHWQERSILQAVPENDTMPLFEGCIFSRYIESRSVLVAPGGFTLVHYSLSFMVHCT